jgi:hypothetical protein
VLEQIKKDLDIEEIHFVVGRINEYWLDPNQFPDGKLIRELQVKLGESHENGAWIDTNDLNRGINPWGGYSLNDGHFPPPGYRVMGQRFAKAACLLIDPNLDLDENLFREVFFDTIDDVKSHAAIGKPVKSAGSGAGLKGADFAKLTDGKYGSKRHSDSEWLMIEASGEPVELIVDLGEVLKVNEVGVHTLFSKKAGAEYPDSMQFLLSEDGENFQLSNSKYNNTKLNRIDRHLIHDIAKGEECLLVLTEQSEHRNPEPGVSARFVKVLIKTGTQNVLIDEIIVNPVGEL